MINRREVLRVSAVATVAGVLPRLSFGKDVPTVTASHLLSTFSPVLPCYDTDHANTEQSVIHDMGLGYYLNAVTAMGLVPETVRAADILLETRYKAGPTRPGWGLGFAYDAFSDGTTNDAGTVYGVTVACCARGLFDAYALTSDTRYRDAAFEALDYYITVAFSSSATSNRGLFWYSESPHDRTYGVMNVIGLLMGQYARAYSLSNNPAYEDAATRCAHYLIYHKQSDPHGTKWWYRYAGGVGDRYNDPVHAAFIVQGFIDYNKFLPPILDPSSAIDYIEWQAGEMVTGKQRLWGAGQMIFTLTEAGRLSAADNVIANVLPRFEIGGGALAWETGQTKSYARPTAYVLAGLARREAA